MALFSKKNLNKDEIIDDEFYRIACEIAASTIVFDLVPNVDVPLNSSVIYNNYKCDGTIQQEEHK